MNKNFLWLLFSLFLVGAGVLALLGGGNAQDGLHLIWIGGAIFVILAITGSFK